MKEEISRILQMLEEGKINADEAERLLNAVQESSKKQAPEDEFDPLRDIRKFFERICSSQHRAARRQSRWHQYWHIQNARKVVREARERASRMSVEERVGHVLKQQVLVDREEFDGSTRLSDLWDSGHVYWDPRQLLWHALELEFDREIPEDDTRAWQTVQDVIDYLEPKKKTK